MVEIKSTHSPIKGSKGNSTKGKMK